jgi:hypothetical protein
MLMVIDSGCPSHPPRHFTFRAEEAEVLEGLLRSLPPTANHLAYRCSEGHYHDISFTTEDLHFRRRPKATQRESAP